MVRYYSVMLSEAMCTTSITFKISVYTKYFMHVCMLVLLYEPSTDATCKQYFLFKCSLSTESANMNC